MLKWNRRDIAIQQTSDVHHEFPTMACTMYWAMCHHQFQFYSRDSAQDTSETIHRDIETLENYGNDKRRWHIHTLLDKSWNFFAADDFMGDLTIKSTLLAFQVSSDVHRHQTIKMDKGCAMKDKSWGDKMILPCYVKNFSFDESHLIAPRWFRYKKMVQVGCTGCARGQIFQKEVNNTG